MELGEWAELRQAEKTSADQLQTTGGNKRRNYTKRLGKKAFVRSCLRSGTRTNTTTFSCWLAYSDIPPTVEVEWPPGVRDRRGKKLRLCSHRERWRSRSNRQIR